MSSHTDRLVLYSSQGCPYAQRARIALIASGATYEQVEIDLANKPEWYARKINPASKVPAVTYGAPFDSEVSNPPAETFRLPESALVVGFVASLYPKIEYSSPTLRARSALLALQYEALVSKPWTGYFRSTEGNLQPLLDGLRAFQPYIATEFGSKENGWGGGDVLVAPFIGRLLLFARTGNALEGLWLEGSGERLIRALEGEEFTAFREYGARIEGWEAYRRSFDPETLVHKQKERFAAQKKAEGKA